MALYTSLVTETEARIAEFKVRFISRFGEWKDDKRERFHLKNGKAKVPFGEFISFLRENENKDLKDLHMLSTVIEKYTEFYHRVVDTINR